MGMRKVVTPLLRCDYLLPPREGMCVCVAIGEPMKHSRLY